MQQAGNNYINGLATPAELYRALDIEIVDLNTANNRDNHTFNCESIAQYSVKNQ